MKRGLKEDWDDAKGTAEGFMCDVSGVECGDSPNYDNSK